MTSEILKVKKRFGHPPGLEETPLVNFFNLRNSKLIFLEMTSEILKVKKCFGHPPDLEETPLVNFFNLRNSKFWVFW